MATTTSVLGAATLPRTVVLKSKAYSDKGHAYFKADGGSVVVGEDDVFSTVVKIEVERCTTNSKYVNLRFSYFNRYWRQDASSKFVVAESDQPEEDVTKSTCTLFEPVEVDENGVFYLRHVQSGGRVLVDGSTMAMYVDNDDDKSSPSYLSFVDWNTLVKLPPRIALKGDNGKYLKVDFETLKFASEDPNDENSSFIVEQGTDGNVKMTTSSAVAMKYCWLVTLTVNSWVIVADFPDRKKFEAVKIDESTIAIRSVDNNNFCRRLTSEIYESIVDGLSASATSIIKEAILQVQESVLQRKIYNVVYQMEYARILDEAPYLAGSASLTNSDDEEANMSVSITFQDQKSYSFTRSLSLTAGVTASIEAGLPFIEKASIAVNYQISGTFQWDNTTTTTTSVTATGTVPVPGKSTVTVDYVGTRGTCNIPYSYTQEDRSSIDGKPIYTDLFDGIYSGISYYNFSFQVRQTKPL